MRVVGGGLALATFLLVLGGCSGGTEVTRTLEPAIIDIGYEDPNAQNSVMALGRSLSVQAVSFGDSCRERGEARVEVFEQTRTVEVRPRDWLTMGRGCRSILNVFTHHVSVDVRSPGEWVVRIIGVKGAVSGSGSPEPHEIVLRVDVS